MVLSNLEVVMNHLRPCRAYSKYARFINTTVEWCLFLNLKSEYAS